jgi:hypothetical protein
MFTIQKHRNQRSEHSVNEKNRLSFTRLVFRSIFKHEIIFTVQQGI